MISWRSPSVNRTYLPILRQGIALRLVRSYNQLIGILSASAASLMVKSRIGLSVEVKARTVDSPSSIEDRHCSFASNREGTKNHEGSAICGHLQQPRSS